MIPRLLVVAAAGYGKSASVLEDGLQVVTPDSLTAGTVTGPVAVEDVHALPPHRLAALVATVDAYPHEVRLTSREPLRLGLRTPGFQRTAWDLALSATRTTQVLRDEHGVADAVTAGMVHELTAGWPALVRLAGDDLGRASMGAVRAPVGAVRDPLGAPARIDGLLETLGRPDGPVATWLLANVVDGGQDSHRLAALARLGPLTDDLATELLGPEGAGVLSRWRAVGMVAAHPAYLHRSDRPVRVVPLLSVVLARTRSPGAGPPGAQGPGDPAEADLRTRAARWYEENGYPAEAAVQHAAAGDPAGATRLVRERWEEMLRQGSAPVVAGLLTGPGVEVARSEPPADPVLSLALADALRVTGDTASAWRAFSPLIAGGAGGGPALAWRIAQLHYACGQYQPALEVLRSARPARLAGRDDVLLDVCLAHVLQAVGDAGAGPVAAGAVAAAEARGDDDLVAAARLAAYTVTGGDAAAEHLEQSLLAARRAGDVVQLARGLVNHSFLLLTAARYAEAAEVGAEAVRLCGLGSPPGRLVVGLHNLGEALTMLGRFEEAQVHLQRGLDMCHRLGLQRGGLAHLGLAEVHRWQGRREQALAAYGRAVDVAAAAGEPQILVPALAGAARALAELPGSSPPDLQRAAGLAAQAAAAAGPEQMPAARVAQGWVALAAGDLARSAAEADMAVAAAREGSMADALAEALELRAAVRTVDAAARGVASVSAGDEEVPARAELAEALSVWQRGGALLAADRVTARLGALPGAGGEERARGRAATRRLARSGVPAPLGVEPGPSRIGVRLLGAFAVTVDGREVPLPAWKSRQARTLVKILATRHGRTVPRPELCELLWPDDDPARTSHRLSVLLNVVRQVLDPGRHLPADHYLPADQWGIRLDPRRAVLDTDHVLQDWRLAQALLHKDPAGAEDLLRHLVENVRGEVLEDDPYDTFADGLREEVRAARLGSLRSLAGLLARRGRPAEAVALLVRVVAADPYDETGHSSLVRLLGRTGRHGEARRAAARWADAMREIGVRPRADATLTPSRHARPTHSPRLPGPLPERRPSRAGPALDRPGALQARRSA